MKLWPFQKTRGFDAFLAAALFVLALVGLCATQGDVGFVRDESLYFVAGESYARWFQLLLAHPSAALSDATIVHFFDINHEHPALMKTLFGLSSLVLHPLFPALKPAFTARLPAFATAALIPALTYLFGAGVYGRFAGLFAAVSFFLVPRQFFNAHLACFDIPIACAWLGVVYALWRAPSRKYGWLACGVIFGLALATKHNGLFLPVVLAPLAWLKSFRETQPKTDARALVLGWLALQAGAFLLYAVLWVVFGEAQFVKAFSWLSPQLALFVLLLGGSVVLLRRLSRVGTAAFRPLAAITAMELFGPALFYLLWPYLWHHPVERTARYLQFHAQHNNYTWFYLGKLLREPPFPLEYVLVVTALTVPLSLLAPMATGLFSTLARALRDLVSWASRRAMTDHPLSFGEVLILCNALASIAIISHPEVPHFGGVKHWFPSMPFLAILGGHAVCRACEGLRTLLSWKRPVRFVWVGTAVFALLCAPALWATVRSHPYGTSYYSELAGGIPGAASLGMQRQFWSNNVTGVLPWINQHAEPGARVWLHEVTYYAFRQYQENGLLRRDLQPASGPQDASLAAYQYHQEFREQEMSIWQAFGTEQPVSGLYLDETPQVVVYQRRR